MLDHAKDKKNPKKTKFVYLIMCHGGKLHIGNTSDFIQTRLKEHSVDTIHGRIKKYTLTKCHGNSRHHIF